MAQRQPGTGRYAHPECERRWLLDGPPPGLVAPRDIVDRYLDGTRLRLRRVGGTGDEPSLYKLGQKVRADLDDPSAVMLTNIYLDEDEYDRLLVLPAAELHKTRHELERDDDRFAVDVFGGELDGLVLAEIELDPDTPPTLPPPRAVADVTTDDRFSGGRLARTTAADLNDLLAAFGLRP